MAIVPADRQEGAGPRSVSSIRWRFASVNVIPTWTRPCTRREPALHARPVTRTVLDCFPRVAARDPEGGTVVVLVEPVTAPAEEVEPDPGCAVGWETAGARTLGAGAVGGGSFGAGSVGVEGLSAGSFGAGTVGVGRVGGETGGTGTVGAGIVGVGIVGIGAVGAGTETVGSGSTAGVVAANPWAARRPSTGSVTTARARRPVIDLNIRTHRRNGSARGFGYAPCAAVGS